MREIKFRAWDKGWKKMHGPWDPLEAIPGSLVMRDPHPEGFEYMQYTGLKDKNGKEIYEGDIIRYDRRIKDPKKLYIVKWESRFGEYGDCCGYDGLSSYGEVIGNIYENPELLETGGKPVDNLENISEGEI